MKLLMKPNEIPNENVNKVCMELSKNVKFPLKMKQFQINLENFKCKWDHKNPKKFLSNPLLAVMDFSNLVLANNLFKEGPELDQLGTWKVKLAYIMKKLATKRESFAKKTLSLASSCS